MRWILLNSDWDYQFGHAQGYLEAMGYKLVLDRNCDTCVDFQTNTVKINSRFSHEVQFYLLLHELGHVLISEDGRNFFDSEHPSYGRFNGVSPNVPRATRVNILGEEYEAWRIGRRWARMQELFIDDSKYDKTMTKNLMSYIDWAADPSKFEVGAAT